MRNKPKNAITSDSLGIQNEFSHIHRLDFIHEGFNRQITNFGKHMKGLILGFRI